MSFVFVPAESRRKSFSPPFSRLRTFSQNRRRPLVLVAAAVAALSPVLSQRASAETLYWDTNGSTTGSGNTDLASWDQTFSPNWSLNSAGEAETQYFNPGDAAVFSAG